jgi:hypothetical protein
VARLLGKPNLAGLVPAFLASPLLEYLRCLLMQLLLPGKILRVAAEGQGWTPISCALYQMWSFGLAQVHDNAAKLQVAIGAPENLKAGICDLAGRCPPTELALFAG